MNNLSPLDQLDPSNVGGREQMMNRMTNHQIALLTVKPMVQSLKPPKPHVDAKGKHEPVKFKKMLEYGNVYKTFRAITANQKPRIDVKVPETEKFKSFWGRQNKAQKFAEREHQNNLRAQKARMDNVGSMVERKKNNNDPFAHPTYLLTADTQPRVNGALLKQILKPQKIASTVHLSSTMLSKAPKKQLLAEGGNNQNKRPSSAAPAATLNQSSSYRFPPPPKAVLDKNRIPKTITKEDYEKYQKDVALNRKKNLYGEPEMDFEEEIPKNFNATENGYQSVKEDLLQVIIKYRLYQENDLKILFGRTVLHNEKMNIDRLQEIFDEITTELDA